VLFRFRLCLLAALDRCSFAACPLLTSDGGSYLLTDRDRDLHTHPQFPEAVLCVSFLNPLGAAMAQLSKQLHLPRAGARVAVPGKHRRAPSVYWLAGVSKAELADCSVGKTPTRPARSAASNFFQKLEPIPLACDCLEQVLNIWAMSCTYLSS
jgi:hypothetical protein